MRSLFSSPPVFFYVAYKLSVDQGVEVPLLLIFGLAVDWLLIGFRYMASAWRKDMLMIAGQHFILTEQKGLKKMQRTFKRTGVTDLRFLKKPELMPHPLAGTTFNYLGFQVRDQIINEIFEDPRIA